MKNVKNNLLLFIYADLKNNNNITEKSLANKYFVSERTIRRYIKILKDNDYVYLINYGKKKKWKINDKNFN